MSKNIIPVLEKAIRVIERVASDAPSGSSRHLADELGVSQTTCYRILQTFRDADWVRQEKGVFRISAGLLPIAQCLTDLYGRFELLRPVLVDLVARTGLTSKLSIRQGDEALNLLREESPRPLAVTGRVGGRSPLAEGSNGAALLSALDDDDVKAILDRAPERSWEHQTPEDVLTRIARCRESGIAADLGGFHPYIHAVSTLLRDSARQPVAAISLIGLPSDITEETLPDLAGHLGDARKRCEELLQGLYA